jgi:hypothetical protein
VENHLGNCRLAVVPGAISEIMSGINIRRRDLVEISIPSR